MPPRGNTSVRAREHLAPTWRDRDDSQEDTAETTRLGALGRDGRSPRSPGPRSHGQRSIEDRASTNDAGRFSFAREDGRALSPKNAYAKGVSVLAYFP